jgi:HK97 gp10 family phage protein
MKKTTAEQVKELQNDFRLMSVDARTNMQKAILKACIAVESTAKRKVSRGRTAESIDGEPPRVDTGRLRASITHRVLSNTEGTYGEVGTNVDYAVDLEFGTTTRKWKHPFMVPSLDQNEKKIERLLEEGLNAAIEQETFNEEISE